MLISNRVILQQQTLHQEEESWEEAEVEDSDEYKHDNESPLPFRWAKDNTNI